VKLLSLVVSFWTDQHSKSIVEDYPPEFKTNTVLLDKGKVFDNKDE